MRDMVLAVGSLITHSGKAAHGRLSNTMPGPIPPLVLNCKISIFLFPCNGETCGVVFTPGEKWKRWLARGVGVWLVLW